MLKVAEKISQSGELLGVFLQVRDEQLEIVEGTRVLRVPTGALDAVMRRYGSPFDPGARISRIASLELGAERTVHHVRHLAGYDVIARDYLVYETTALPEPLCALATTVAGALAHLARA